MKYQITCENCEKLFLVDAKPGQTVKCICPGCGGIMQFSLPLSEQQDTKPLHTSQYTHHTRKAQRSNDKSINPIMAGITIGLSLLAVLAVILFAASHYGNRPIEPETSGYINDTVATRPEYKPLPEPVQEEGTDTIVKDAPIQEQETEPEEEPEKVELLEADTMAIE